MEVSKSRADYFKERRKATKTFYVEIDAEIMDKLMEILQSRNLTKKAWFLEKAEEEIARK